MRVPGTCFRFFLTAVRYRGRLEQARLALLLMRPDAALLFFAACRAMADLVTTSVAERVSKLESDVAELKTAVAAIKLTTDKISAATTMPWWLRVLGEDEERGVETDLARSQRLPLVRGAKAAKRAVFEDRRRNADKKGVLAALRHSLAAAESMSGAIVPQMELAEAAVRTSSLLKTVFGILDCLAYADTLFSDDQAPAMRNDDRIYKLHRFSDAQSSMVQLELHQLDDGRFFEDLDDASASVFLDIIMLDHTGNAAPRLLKTARDALCLIRRGIDAFESK